MLVNGESPRPEQREIKLRVNPAELMGRVLYVEKHVVLQDGVVRNVVRDNGQPQFTAELMEGTPGEGWVEVWRREVITGQRSLELEQKFDETTMKFRPDPAPEVVEPAPWNI